MKLPMLRDWLFMSNQQGRKLFYRYMFSGNSRVMKIGGIITIVSLAEARKRHADAMLTLQSGIDPGKKAQEEKMRRIAAPTFNDLLDEFWKIELSKTSSSHERKRLVDKDALPRWKKCQSYGYSPAGMLSCYWITSGNALQLQRIDYRVFW